MQEPTPPSLKTKVLGNFFYWFIRVLDWSCHVRFPNGRKEIDSMREGGPARIVCHWHNRLVFFGALLQRQVREHGLKITMMSSLSKDGNLGAYTGYRSGAVVVRGSPSRRASEGLRQLYRVMVGEGRSLVLLPDGSKGPVYKVKVGAIALAKMTGTLIVPTSYWASDYWRIKSWDRLIIPKPFSRIVVTIGRPIEVPKRAKGEELETKKEELEKELDRLGFAAFNAFPERNPVVL